MPSTQIPGPDLQRVADYCTAMWPQEYHDRVRGEYHVRGTTVTLCELRAPAQEGGERIHEAFAQVRYRPASGDWALYWADHSSRWHEYQQGNVFAGPMARLLREVDEDRTGIFKG